MFTSHILMLFLLSVQIKLECSNRGENDIPIILVHGLVKGKGDMDKLQKKIQKDFPSRIVVSVEIMFGHFSTVFERQDRYVKEFARSIKKTIEKYEIRNKHEYPCIDLIGHSQGGFLARAYTQLNSGQEQFPSVRRIYSLAGVQGGFYCFHKCGPLNEQNPLIAVAQVVVKPEIVYSLFSQYAVTPAMQWKDPIHYKQYQKSKNVLCQINGECVNSTRRRVYGKYYKVGTGRANIVELEKFYTFYSASDEIISPPQSEQFDFYYIGSRTRVQPFRQSALYKEDRIGMKALYTKGRWKNYQVLNFRHRDFVDASVNYFYKNCLGPLIRNEGDLLPNCK